MKREYTQIVCDILIIGAGSSGLWAAKAAREMNPDVKILIVDKANPDWGGQMTLSGGDLEVCSAPDTPADWVEDFVYYWDGLCEQDVVEEIWEHSRYIREQYEQMGCRYLKDEKGRYRTVPQRSLPHVKLQPVEVKGTGGPNMRNCMIREMDRLEIPRMARVEVTKLLKNKDHICGAVGFQYVTGEALLFEAKTVILCTGNMGWKPSYNNNTMAGEGQTLALDAGAELRNCEFLHIWNVPKLFEWEGQTVLMPLGAKFVNGNGENFMERYAPELGANTDPHYTTRGMAKEIREGRGPIRLDLSGVPQEARPIIRPAVGRHLLHYQKLLDVGIDFFADDFECIPQVQLGIGAIVTDRSGQTAVKGLYAAGRCRSIDPGVYMGGFALMTTAITGCQAGEAAAAEAASMDRPAVDIKEAESALEHTFAPLGQEGMMPHLVLEKLQELIAPYDVSILKNKQALELAIEKLEQIKERYLSRLAAADSHYLLKLEEVKAIARATEYYLRAALFREDSRAGHYRTDFPQHYEDWLCWVVLSQKDGRLLLRKQPVPTESYPHPIRGYYADQFAFEAEPPVASGS